MDRSFIRISKLATLLFASALLFACSGDTGPEGPEGPEGPIGPPGQPGTGTSTAVPIQAAERIDVTIESVAVPAGGGAPTVTMRLTDALGFGLRGLPAASVGFNLAQLSPGQAGSSSEWQSYFTRDSAGIPNAQATTESASDGTYTDNGDGTYTYTFAQDLTAYPAGPTFDATKTHRLGVEIRTNRNGFLPFNIPANNAPYDFVPSGGAPTFTRLIVNTATCNACHDELAFHGEARFDIEYCVTCHNPYSVDGDTINEPWEGTVDMKRMIHKIHFGENLAKGYFIVGHGGSVHDYGGTVTGKGVVFPQDVRNCTTCHAESDTSIPQASNWRTVQNRLACGACHDDIDFANGGHPGGVTFTDDSQCVICHGEDAPPVNGRDVRVASIHTIPEAVAAENFKYEVVGVTNSAPGQQPIVQIRVVNPNAGNTAYDINDPAGPFQTSNARLRVDIAWNTDEFGNLDPNNELARPAASGQPFAPISIDFKTGATNVGNNVFEKQAADAIPLTVTGSGVAILEGRPQVVINGTTTSLAVISSGITFAITDTLPVDRRQVVNIDKCNDCHKRLSIHGDNRVGNTELCATCHNPNATDVNRRAVGSACELVLGPVEEAIDLKRMVHRIHAGNVALCGFSGAHDYRDLTYPGHLNNCEGCHVAGTYYPVDPTKVLGTTVSVGADRSVLTDDVVLSPNVAVCSSCHTSNLAANHMIQNGGDFDAGKDNTGVLSSSGVETCQLCHGRGALADVAIMHGVGDFQFN